MNFVLSLATLFVSYANGANDNFKGVATLYGGKVFSYKKALIWATITTLGGSLLSFILATKLLALFSGKGMVNQTILQNPAFLATVALAAASTVMLATLLRFPISTTHGLVGGLVGAGIASGGLTSLAALGNAFVLPLLLGPITAMLLTTTLYFVFHKFRVATKIESSYCLCIGETQEVLVGAPGLLTIRSTGVSVSVEQEKDCRLIYPGRFFGWNLQKVMDQFHIVSAGAVCFARALNDTPKIAALLLLVPFLSPKVSLLLVAIVMAIGGAIHSHRIARKMSFDVTDMNPGQAFTGNIVTALLVISGSVLGLPISTTHVSCGALFGIGMLNGTARKKTILQILLAWVITLPTAAILAALFWFILEAQ
jgi:PiT family inorganic phosphate transporter